MKRVLVRVRFLRDHRWVPPHASEYLDAELSSDERRRLESHLADCPECRELLHSLRALIGALATIRDDEGRLVARAVRAAVHGRLGELPRDSTCPGRRAAVS
jgi:anti-sigma factor RsiW